MTRLATFSSLLLLAVSLGHAELNYEFKDSWLQLPEGQEYLGNSHGEIDVDSAGHVYISVEGESAGLQVFKADGSYSHAVPNLPGSLHGFVIKDDFIYASVLSSGSVIKATLEGEIVLTIESSAFPGDKVGPKGLKLTSVDVAPNGDIFVVDGYGIDNIFVFNPDGSFKTVFGGQGEPYNLDNCHKIFIDPRYEEPRILCCDRKNHRLIHLSLEGDVIGVLAEDLRRPSAASFHGDYVCIAEIAGRISILDKEGKLVATLGTNETEGEINTNRVKPEQWKTGIVTAPHGITFDADGNVLMSEWNVTGRVLRWDRQP